MGWTLGSAGVRARLWTGPGVCWGQTVSWDQAGPWGLWDQGQAEVWGLWGGGWIVGWPLGSVGPGWALGSGRGGRLWAGPWGLWGQAGRKCCRACGNSRPGAARREVSVPETALESSGGAPCRRQSGGRLCVAALPVTYGSVLCPQGRSPQGCGRVCGGLRHVQALCVCTGYL